MAKSKKTAKGPEAATKTTIKKEDQAMKKTAKEVPAVMAETAPEVKEVPKVAKKKKAPEKKEKVEKAKSAITIMKELLKKKATDAEISKVFTAIYTAKGKDAEFTAKRIAIYKKIATKEAANGKK